MDLVEESIALLDHGVILGIPTIRRIGDDHTGNLVNNTVQTTSSNKSRDLSSQIKDIK